MIRIAVLLLSLMLAAPAARACGPDSGCAVGDRSYRIRMPQSQTAPPLRALVFVHGYRGNAAGVMGNPHLAALAQDLGVALIAVQSGAADWNIAGVPAEDVATDDDELAYFDAVMADAAARFGIDPRRTVVAGFSSGGMMVWTLACHRGGDYLGFVPMSGTFWQPVPESCDSPPAGLVHLHGRADEVVPLAGRPIKDSHQGDVAAALAMYAGHGAFAAPEPLSLPGMECQTRRNPGGRILALCLFDGGHSFGAQRLRQAWDLLQPPGKG